jgi:hypothetical protein
MKQVNILQDYKYSENGVDVKELKQGGVSWISSEWFDKLSAKGIVKLFEQDAKPETKVTVKSKRK